MKLKQILVVIAALLAAQLAERLVRGGKPDIRYPAQCGGRYDPCLVKIEDKIAIDNWPLACGSSRYNACYVKVD